MINTLILFFLFIYGSIFGSFLVVVGLRVPTKSLFKENRSYCDSCKRKLEWNELIPIFSYFYQKGKCKKCEEKISLIYPVFEGITGVLFSYSYVHFHLNEEFILSLLIISLVIPIIVSDLIYQIIPNKILFFYTPFFVLYRFFNPAINYGNSIFGALFAFTIVFLIIILSKGGIGIGDLKYYTLLGFIFGLTNFVFLFFLSVFYGLIASLIMLKTKMIKPESRIPFGPYISLSALTILYFNDALVQISFELFGYNN